MSITGDTQNININGNLIVPSGSNKIRTPLIQFFDNTTLNTANGIWSSNVSGGLLYNGNVTANYFMGNASTLTSLTGASAGTYGSANAIPTVSVDSTGRITSITSNPINTVANGSTGQVAFYNQSNVIGGSVGLGYTVGTQSLTVGGSMTVGGDLFVSGNTYTGNNAVFNDTIVEIGNSYPNNTTLGVLMQRPAGNVMIGYLTSEGGGAYTNTLTLGYTFSSAAGAILVPDTGNALPVHVLGTLTADDGLYGNILGSNTISASNVLITGTSNLVGNTVASNISVFSISFGGTSNGYVRSVSLQDVTDISNVTTDYITTGSLSVTARNPVFLTSVTALGTWSGTPTPNLNGSSLAAFSATIGANITNFTPTGGLINGTYTIYAVSGGSYTIAASVAGSVSNLSSNLSLTNGNRVLITIIYDGTVYYVNYVKYS